ncbi:MAG: hypothetical protein AABX66_03080 [Nanoarchaeota archaeon]
MTVESASKRQLRECEVLGGLMGRFVSGVEKTESDFSGYIVFTSNSWTKAYVEGNFSIEHERSDSNFSLRIRRKDGSYASAHDCDSNSLSILPNEIANAQGFLNKSKLSVNVTGSDSRIDFYLSADQSKLALPENK